jgi:hypothetical protein
VVQNPSGHFVHVVFDAEPEVQTFGGTVPVQAPDGHELLQAEKVVVPFDVLLAQVTS